MVLCGTQAGEERKYSGRGRGAADRAFGPPQVGFGRAAGAGGEADVRVRDGTGEGRDLAGRVGEAGGAAAPVIRSAGHKRLALFLLPRLWRSPAPLRACR